MQAELNALALPMEVRILGVNAVGKEAGNAAICNGRDLPWLQDTAAEAAWAGWSAAFEDVIIVDEQNVRMAIFNLSVNDLQNQANYDALKSMLRTAAGG